VAEAFVQVGKSCLLLQLTRVHGLLSDVRLVDLIHHIVLVSTLNICAGLLQVKFLGFVFVLEIDISLDGTVSSGGGEASRLGHMKGSVGWWLEIQEGVTWGRLRAETRWDNEFVFVIGVEMVSHISNCLLYTLGFLDIGS